MVFESVPVVQGKAAAKRLRLFGVNMDCPISDSDECDILSSSAAHLASSPSLRPQDHDKGKGSMSLDLDLDI
ncbi:hypothetical protein SASPL_143019 [Salvia splendens]|uniref:Uncharacterized protein n=2 Tax=Salvia splendens TaxID=180675 RepID=A0A8X8WL00_SALSN|nr:hypothetical protein SASPL_143019 [Salvia splendens]